MKTLNRFIIEKLKLNKDIEIVKDYSFDEIFKYIWVLLGFNPNENNNTFKTYTDTIKRWIKKYDVTINNIDETFMCGSDVSTEWFNRSKNNIKKHLGANVAENFVLSYLDYNYIKIFKDFNTEYIQFENNFYIAYNEYGIMFYYPGSNHSSSYAYVITLKNKN